MAEPREDKIAEELKHTLDAQTAITAQEAARTQSDLDTQPQPSPNDDATKTTEENQDKQPQPSPNDDATKTTEENQEELAENMEHLAIKKSDDKRTNEGDASDEEAEVEEQADPTQNAPLTLDQELEKILVKTEETTTIVATEQEARTTLPSAKQGIEEDLPVTPTPTATRAG